MLAADEQVGGYAIARRHGAGAIKMSPKRKPGACERDRPVGTKAKRRARPMIWRAHSETRWAGDLVSPRRRD